MRFRFHHRLTRPLSPAILLLACASVAGCGGPTIPAPAHLATGPVPATAARTQPSAPLSLPAAPSPARLAQPFRDRGWKPTKGGTGFFIRTDGKLVSNAHVIEGCSGLTLEDSAGTEAVVEPVAADPAEDLALLQTKAEVPAVALLRDTVSEDGRPLAVIGYPEYGLPRLKPFMVLGRLSGQPIGGGRRYSFQAEIRHGNSGGPILDRAGSVIGMVVAKIDTVSLYQQTGLSIGKVGIAIANQTLRRFLLQHGVEPGTATEGKEMEDVVLFNESRRFIVRLLCWQPSDK